MSNSTSPGYARHVFVYLLLSSIEKLETKVNAKLYLTFDRILTIYSVSLNGVRAKSINQKPYPCLFCTKLLHYIVLQSLFCFESQKECDKTSMFSFITSYSSFLFHLINITPNYIPTAIPSNDSFTFYGLIPIQILFSQRIVYI